MNAINQLAISARLTYALCATVGITLRSADAQHVDGAAVAAEEAAIVEAIRVDASQEALRRAYGELHALLVARLRNCKKQFVICQLRFDRIDLHNASPVGATLPSMHSPSLRPMLRS